MAERSRLLVLVFCLYFLHVTMVDASRKDTKLKPKDRAVNPAMESVFKNISALWHEVEFLHQPIHIHIHGDGEVMKDPSMAAGARSPFPSLPTHGGIGKRVGISSKACRNENSDHVHLHGIHIHEFADMTQGCTSMGGHFNPEGVSHGAPDASKRHVGDWGNLVVNEEGVAFSRFNDTVATLLGFETILGRGLVIHGAEDDLGLGGTDASLKTGNAGGRLACCVIIAVGPAPEVWG
ncbi:superoxide dismutase [Cu-Zn]-like [Pomacea canaliculata]|uniref:superoxide dismutase [Cu-Zn]-like n=1 Tax=Pomacea canaliculata TaxID=400727 RepID=UPI000D73A332|nr:superoxide dismutase [Cu-Zn]-like [Pomacea canaliculata]